MKKTLYSCILSFFIGGVLTAQTVTLANFDFNGSTGLPISAATTTTGITASINGTQSNAAYTGTVTGSGAFVSNAAAGNALSMSNSSGTNTQYWTLTLGGSALNTYQGYKAYFQTEHSGTGATTITTYYSIDGSTFTALSQTVATGNTVFTESLVDMSGVTAINKQSTVYIRLAASGASGTGTLRIDNLQIQASLAPVTTWQNNGSNIYYTSGNVGIGNSNPAYPLDVTGSARVSGALTSGATSVSSLNSSGSINTVGNFTVTGSSLFTGAIKNSTLSGTGSRVLVSDANGNITALSAGTSSQVLFGNNTWGSLPTQVIQTSGSNAYFTGGNFGLGNNNPQVPLDVTGNARISGNLYVGGGLIESPKVSAITSLNTDSVNALSGSINFADSVKMSKTLKVNNNIDAKSISFGGVPTFSFTPATVGKVNQLNLLSNTSINGNLNIPALAATTGGYQALFVDSTGNLTYGKTIGTSPCVNCPPFNIPSCSVTNPSWLTGGNTIGNFANPVLGTCDNHDLVFEAYSHQNMWLKTTGQLCIGTYNSTYVPLAQLDITTSGSNAALNINNPFSVSMFNVGNNGATLINAIATVANPTPTPLTINSFGAISDPSVFIVKFDGSTLINSKATTNSTPLQVTGSSPISFIASFVGTSAIHSPSTNFIAGAHSAGTFNSLLQTNDNAIIFDNGQSGVSPSGGFVIGAWNGGGMRIDGATGDVNILTSANSSSTSSPFVITSTTQSQFPDLKLFEVAYNGQTYAREIFVKITQFPDYVFKNDYKLMPLSEVEKYYKANQHLPEVPSEKEIQEKGMNVGDMNTILLKKVEELTLYIVDLKKEVEGLKKNSNK